MIFFRLLIILSAGGALYACTPAIKPASHTAAQLQHWQQHQQAVNKLTHWRLQGRIAMTTEEENWVAKLTWEQKGNQYQLRFSDPLGQGALQLNGDQHGVQLRTADGQRHYANSPKELFDQELNIPLPVNALLFWVRGIPENKQAITTFQLNNIGQLQQLKQQAWQIDYPAYHTHLPVSLPRKVFAKYAEDVNVKLIISQWTLYDRNARSY